MFQDNLYSIHQHDILEGGLHRYTISFNSAHPIFAAHFPNRPIVPGACIVQVVKELVEQQLSNPLNIIEVKNVKFTELILPISHFCYLFDVVVTPIENRFAVKAIVTLSDGNKCFTKLSMMLTR